MSISQLITQRYQVLDTLGQGGMGVVYRALDRLTGQVVALKQVVVAPQSLAFASRPNTNDTDDLLLSLAHEFRLLASLRHPNIISVLDYGFDHQRQPYFTMELLDQPQTLLEIGRDQPLVMLIDLIIQTLQALAYLHRRGILHRDLKPENILVSQGSVRLLDFGLSIICDQAKNADTSGTLLYMAPEVLEGAAHSEATDLYAVGVLAYEMLVGQHPFYQGDFSDFLDRVLDTEVDLTPLAQFTVANAPLSLTTIIQKLLVKQPTARYPSAAAVIADLCAAIGQPLPTESIAIRESFLQAATFVGREQELTQLNIALHKTLQGQGSAWLVGGESGVGKSRLLDELRIQALVAGATVLRGQAVEGGCMPYQLWHDPLRHLVLAVELSDLEAGVLKAIIPDIATLLEREIPAVPPLNGNANRQRLVWVVTNLIRRQQRPLVCLFEDLQWADESLTLLAEVIRLTITGPLLFVGSYRSEERPHLPGELPDVQTLSLGRLPATAIAQLSYAMLGERGRQPQIITLLERESEGNTFFMVEVVRALAQEAGGLSGIGEVTLPDNVFTGGLQRLIERRLHQVADADFPLLQLAAIMGRTIDLAALRLATTNDMTGWLLRCADVAVLEIQADTWRFAHDKLREGMLQQLTDEQRVHFHRQAAVCIQQAYNSDLASQAGRLTEHYRHAGDEQQELYFAHKAGDYASATFAHAEATRHYSRTLALTSDVRTRFTLLLAIEDIWHLRGEREKQSAELQTLTQIAEQLDEDQLRLEVLLRWLRQAKSLGNLLITSSYAQQTLALADSISNAAAHIEARLIESYVFWRQGDYKKARRQLTEELTLAQANGLAKLTAACLRHLGNLSHLEGDFATGIALTQQAWQISRDIGDQQSEVTTLHDLGVNLMPDRPASNRVLEEALQLSRKIGNLYFECCCLLKLAVNARAQGNYDLAFSLLVAARPLAQTLQERFLEIDASRLWGSILVLIGDFPNAQAKFEQCLQLARSIGARNEQIVTLLRLSNLALMIEQVEVAETYANNALPLAQKGDSTYLLGMTWGMLGQVRLHTDDLTAATTAFQTSLNLLKGHPNQCEVLDAFIGLVQVKLAQNQTSEAQRHVDELLAWQATHPLLTFSNPALAYLILYRVFVQQQPARADAFLEEGYQLLQRNAASLSDPAQRQSYLDNVPAHRNLLSICAGRMQTPQMRKT